MAASVHLSVPSHLGAQGARQLDGVRAALLADLHSKAAEVAEHDARARALTGQTDTDSLLERELAEAGASRAQEAIGEIESALARIESGNYGLCEACGERVAPERLEAIPHVRYCVTCSAVTRGASS